MNIEELINELQVIQREHSQITVSGICGYGHPEMTIESVTYEPSGPLASANPGNNQDKLPERVLIAWQTVS